MGLLIKHLGVGWAQTVAYFEGVLLEAGSIVRVISFLIIP